MRFAGIDVGGERHMVAMVGEEGEVLCRSSPWRGRVGLCASVRRLLAKGYAVAVLNPLRTRRFAEEEQLQRTKTDAIDA